MNFNEDAIAEVAEILNIEITLLGGGIEGFMFINDENEDYIIFGYGNDTIGYSYENVDGDCIKCGESNMKLDAKMQASYIRFIVDYINKTYNTKFKI